MHQDLNGIQPPLNNLMGGNHAIVDYLSEPYERHKSLTEEKQNQNLITQSETEDDSLGFHQH